MGKSEKDIQSAEKVEMQSERASRALHFEVEMSKIRLVFPIINFQLMTTIWILDPATRMRPNGTETAGRLSQIWD